MKKIITLTVNPAIDKSTSVDGIRPNSKLRCENPIYEAGGGGINVSRVLKELGATSLCMYISGGPKGNHLKAIIDSLDIPQEVIPISGDVRENLSVTDTTNNQQYRFGMPGPMVNKSEWKNTLRQLEAVLSEGDLIVASGSLCLGIPIDFFAQVSKISHKKNAKFILDTSGKALFLGAQAGAFLLKPNLEELATLCGLKTIPLLELETIAKGFIEHNPCEILVVSLGEHGAILLTQDAVIRAEAPIVHQKSTIGAGDSMVAGMVLALALGKSLTEMVQYGVACGTAATITSGTQLCKKKDVEELAKLILTNSNTSQKIKI